MTINISLIMTPCPPIVIMNGGKNSVWEKQETEQWHGVKNITLMTPYRFPHHSSRFFAGAPDDD